MLQNFYKNITVSALALAAPGLAATAQGCDLSDGFATGPAAYTAEAEACLAQLGAETPAAEIENALRGFSSEARQAADRKSFKDLASLNEAARLHALDMSQRNYAAHTDLEGRTHLDRVRILDRRSLLGAFGANVTVIDARASAREVFDALTADPTNAANLTRPAFDHMGIGAVEADGKLYIVQLFARLEGQLATPLPNQLTSYTDLSPVFEEGTAKAVNWSVVTEQGEVIAKGLGKQISPASLTGEEGYVNIEMELGNDVYTVKGPAISMF